MELYHKPGWKSVWRIYSRANLKKSITIPLTVSTCLIVICAFSEKDYFSMLKYVSETVISIGPNILGFTLSGYALMMGMSSSEFIKGLIKHKPAGKAYSLYQLLNSTFAVVLFLMFITILQGIIVGFIVELNLNFPFKSDILLCIYNGFWLWLLLFFITYMITSIKDIVMNIFNFGQYVQVYVDKRNNNLN